MKYQVVLATLAVIATLSYVGYKHCHKEHLPKDMTDSEVRKLWVQWRQEYRKGYLFGEEMNRYNIFKANNKFIQDSNNAVPKKSYTLGHNQFSDLTREEYKARYLNLKPSPVNRKLNFEENLENLKVPTSWDWRQHGAVNKVKNQGNCGSCWAFSAVAAMEGAYFVQHGKLMSFSEQQLLNCDKVDSACNGGLMDYAFQYAEKHAMVTESELPYKGKKQKCNIRSKTAYAQVASFHDVTPKSESALMAAVYQQPTSIAVEADQGSFQFYNSGVMTSKCGANLDHGVAVVGYGTDAGSGHDYWLVRNSWGPSWGSSGYIKLARGGKYNNLNGGYGQCGIMKQPSYPKLK